MPEVDDCLIRVFTTLAETRGCSVDDVLECPLLRQAFLDGVRLELGALPERQLLHRLVNLRKQKRLPRSRELHHS